jgi:predicted hydrocarbon binding protein
MNDCTLSSHFLNLFAETAASELGQEKFFIVLENAGLSTDRSNPARWGSLNGGTTAQTYAGLQKAMRTYYGRGARGILRRVGSNMWRRLLGEAPLGMKAQSKMIFGLPVNARRKPALELLAKLLADRRGDETVHTLDLDLLLVDKASPGTLGQNESEHICYVTLGLLRECLHWVTGQEHDIEETACRAKGEDACEFKITTGR